MWGTGGHVDREASCHHSDQGGWVARRRRPRPTAAAGALRQVSAQGKALHALLATVLLAVLLAGCSSGGAGSQTAGTSGGEFFSDCQDYQHTAQGIGSPRGAGCRVSLAVQEVTTCRVNAARSSNYDLSDPQHALYFSSLFYQLLSLSTRPRPSEVATIESPFRNYLSYEQIEGIESAADRCNATYRQGNSDTISFVGEGNEISTLCPGEPATSQAQLDANCAGKEFGSDLVVELPGLAPLTGNEAFAVIKEIAAQPTQFKLNKAISAGGSSDDLTPGFLQWMSTHCVTATCQRQPLNANG